MPSMVHTYERGVFCITGSNKKATDEEWGALIAHVKTTLSEEESEVRFLVSTGDAQPDSMQRSALRLASEGHPTRVAVLSASRVVRAGVAVFGDMGHVAVRAFAPGDVAGALSHLEIDVREAPAFERILRAQAAEFGARLSMAKS